MSGDGNVSYPDFAQFFIEVSHIRGNFNKFEFNNSYPSEPEDWVELNVWDYRKRSLENWQEGGKRFRTMRDAIRDEGDPFWPEYRSFRVTRYPELEKDVLDTTYHPSVDSWRINPAKVKEFFNE